MKSLRKPNGLNVAMCVLLVLLGLSPHAAFGKSPVKLQKWAGRIDYSSEQPSQFALAGTASHLGRFTARGEVEFLPGEEEGSLVGEGVVVFEAANGDLIVGVVSWLVHPPDGAGFSGTDIHFSWRDSVEFSDGRVVASTGRFADAGSRPPGLVVIAIIAILIGLLLPAVQK